MARRSSGGTPRVPSSRPRQHDVPRLVLHVVGAARGLVRVVDLSLASRRERTNSLDRARVALGEEPTAQVPSGRVEALRLIP